MSTTISWLDFIFKVQCIVWPCVNKVSSAFFKICIIHDRGFQEKQTGHKGGSESSAFDFVFIFPPFQLFWTWSHMAWLIYVLCMQTPFRPTTEFYSRRSWLKRRRNSSSRRLLLFDVLQTVNENICCSVVLSRDACLNRETSWEIPDYLHILRNYRIFCIQMRMMSEDQTKEKQKNFSLS